MEKQLTDSKGRTVDIFIDMASYYNFNFLFCYPYTQIIPMSKTMWEYTPVTLSLEPLTKAQMLISTQPREKQYDSG